MAFNVPKIMFLTFIQTVSGVASTSTGANEVSLYGGLAVMRSGYTSTDGSMKNIDYKINPYKSSRIDLDLLCNFFLWLINGTFLKWVRFVILVF